MRGIPLKKIASKWFTGHCLATGSVADKVVAAVAGEVHAREAFSQVDRLQLPDSPFNRGTARGLDHQASLPIGAFTTKR